MSVSVSRVALAIVLVVAIINNVAYAPMPFSRRRQQQHQVPQIVNNIHSTNVNENGLAFGGRPQGYLSGSLNHYPQGYNSYSYDNRPEYYENHHPSVFTSRPQHVFSAPELEYDEPHGAAAAASASTGGGGAAASSSATTSGGANRHHFPTVDSYPHQVHHSLQPHQPHQSHHYASRLHPKHYAHPSYGHRGY